MSQTVEHMHAYCIIAHNNFDQLAMLCLALDHPNNEIFIHIDIRSNIDDTSQLEKICTYSKVHVYREIAVKWGCYEQIEVEMLLFEKASKTNAFVFYHLLSGSDLPIRSQDEIHAYFDNHMEENFVDVRHVSKCTSEIQRRARYYHFFVSNRKFDKFLHRAFLVPQILVGVNRTKNKNIDIYYGSNWCSLTHEFVLYLLEQKSLCYKTFNKVNSCDELFVQTIIKQGGFKIHNENGESETSALRFVDWSDGRANPKILDVSDLQKIKASHACFARKFDRNYDAEIFDIVYKIATAKSEGTT